jgi:hypothetical protein
MLPSKSDADGMESPIDLDALDDYLMSDHAPDDSRLAAMPYLPAIAEASRSSNVATEDRSPRPGAGNTPL